MSEELLQRDLLRNPEKIGKWDFYNIGSTSIKSLQQHGILPNIDYKQFSRRKPDAILVRNQRVFAVIENKSPTEFNTTKKQVKAIQQGLEVAQKINAKLLIVTDTTQTIWINVYNEEKILDENGDEIKHVFSPKEEEIIDLLKKIDECIDLKNSQLIPPKLKDPTSLAKQIWQDVWSVSGATPENCLYTFVELFIFKYLSDLGILTGFHSFYDLLKRYEMNTEEAVLEYYADVIRKEIKTKFKENPADKTTIINGTIFVSKDDKAVRGYSTVFKKILEKFDKEGKLENIYHDFKSKLFESFLKESISKKNWGQFFTPLKVVKAIVDMVEVKEEMSICDPACGVGKFLLELIAKDLRRFYKIENNLLTPKLNIIGFDKGFDKDEQKTIILAKANMLIYFSDLIREHAGIVEQFSNLFNQSFLLKTNSILGTLSEPVNEEYDLILTNPPYVTSGSSNLKEEIKKCGLEHYYSISALGVEGLFMQWIIRSLKPGGKAFVVIPDGILNRQNDRQLRAFIKDECFIDAIISLPAKTFFSTIKKTYILALTKKHDKTVTQADPVFTYLVSDIGETLDVYRFETDANHLEIAVQLFNQFKGAKQYFSPNNNRCKIQSIEQFSPDEHWSVDRWWSKAEKIELGIVEEDDKLSIVDFSAYLTDISNTINEYQSELQALVATTHQDKKTKVISLSDTEYFDIFIGKRVLKRDIVKIQGDIPVYSANVFIPFGHLEESNIADFQFDYILWGIDGNFDFNIKKKGEIFATTDHCGAIRVKKEEILTEYLIYQLNQVKSTYGFDRTLRASLKNIRQVKFSIPLQEDGSFDIETQREIAAKYQLIEQIKKELNNSLAKIVNTEINIV